MQTADDLGKQSDEITVRADLGAQKYDIFGTANFFNYKPWAASIEYLLEKGVKRIHMYDDQLVSRFIDNLDRDSYELLSPETGKTRSTLIFISHKQQKRNKALFEHLWKNDIMVAYRVGNLRISPHLYNTEEDIDRALSLLNKIK